MNFRSLLAVVVCLSCLPIATGAEKELPRQMHEWVAGQPGLPDFKVGFTMTRKLPALRDPVKTTGTMWRLRDGRFRWQVGEPAMSVVLYDGEVVRSWDEGGEWKELDSESRKARSWLDLLSGQAATLRELERRFTARLLEDKADSVTVALDPRAAMTRKYLREIRLQWDPRTHHLKSLMIFQGNETEIRIRFDTPSELKRVEPEVFEPVLLN